MIPISEAKARLEKTVVQLPSAAVRLKDACGRVLAADVFACIDSPSFDRSAMDGFAIANTAARISDQIQIEISQTIRAGANPLPLIKNTCARIMTGAMIPDGADTVIPKEDVEESGAHIVLKTDCKCGQYIRRCGEEMKRGEILLNAGTLLTPACMSLLASQGLSEVEVIRKPSVAILATGDEIVRPGVCLEPTQIYDANFFGLTAALSNINIEATDMGIAGDDVKNLAVKISDGLKYDLFLLSGGVSVGDFDHVRNILAESGVKEVFWRVAQKPGKPLYLGIFPEGNLVFGLPGNPAAVLVCFYEYVLPAIKKMMGYKDIWPEELSARLEKNITWPRDRTEFVRGRYDHKNNCARSIQQKESYMLKGFAEANCLIIAEKNIYEEDENVKVHLI